MKCKRMTTTSAGCIEKVYDIFVTDRIDKEHQTAWRRSRKKAFEIYGSKCLRCGAVDKTLVVDHVLPISFGGNKNVENLQVLCQDCHRWKTRKEREKGWDPRALDALDFRS